METTIIENVYEQMEVMEHFNLFHFDLFLYQMVVMKHHSMTCYYLY